MRFIPTCVGFMESRKIETGGQIGSSPRAWGLSTGLNCHVVELRFIPTCVGFIHPGIATRQLQAVHPHVRGVYWMLDGDGTWACWFIPTCVGFIPCLQGQKS